MAGAAVLRDRADAGPASASRARGARRCRVRLVGVGAFGDMERHGSLAARWPIARDLDLRQLLASARDRDEMVAHCLARCRTRAAACSSAIRGRPWSIECRPDAQRRRIVAPLHRRPARPPPGRSRGRGRRARDHRRLPLPHPHRPLSVADRRRAGTRSRAGTTCSSRCATRCPRSAPTGSSRATSTEEPIVDV